MQTVANSSIHKITRRQHCHILQGNWQRLRTTSWGLEKKSYHNTTASLQCNPMVTDTCGDTGEKERRDIHVWLVRGTHSTPFQPKYLRPIPTKGTEIHIRSETGYIHQMMQRTPKASKFNGTNNLFLSSYNTDRKHRQAQKKHKEQFAPERFMFLSSSQTTFQ